MWSSTGAEGAVVGVSPRERRAGRARSGLVALVALALTSACSIDGRRVGVTERGLGGDGGNGGEGPTGGGGAAVLSALPPELNLGAITEGFSAQARLRLRNDGAEPLATPAVAWAAGSDPDLKLLQSQCFGALEVGGECEVRVQLVPSRAEELRGALELSSAPAPTVTVPVSARGLAKGDLLFVPAAGSFENFGGVRVGEVAEATFTVTNPGAVASGPLSFLFNRPELALGEAGAGDCVPDVTSLASGESCAVRVRFSPAERGPLEAVASVTSSAAGSVSVALRGQGLVPGALGASVTTLDFGGVVPGGAATLVIEVENEGDEPLTLARVALEPAGAAVFTIADSNCGEGIVLAAGQACRVSVAFRPVEEGTAAVGTLLLQTAEGDQSKNIALSGRGLTRGSLVVEALTAGDEDFGQVVLTESEERTFRVRNPSPQESGPLTLHASNGFQVLPPEEEGACQPEVTSLSSEDSCSVRVRFSPAARGPSEGALTVDSQLAGASGLSLRGTGVARALLAADTGAGGGVVDFGRVTSGSVRRQTLTLSNRGDEPLGPLSLQVTSLVSEQAAAFGVESACSAPLGFEETCELAVTFAPAVAGPHSASLELSSDPGGRAAVLLLGDAREPGRLVLAPSDPGGEDFGDVALGASVARGFSLSNPGDVASGALTLRTDDSQFTLDLGACGELPAGLGAGEACALSVSFTPATNTAVEARLSALAPVAGETGLALRGRGRSPAALAATTTERDLGRANVGQPSGAGNTFTWTVNNTGDVPSGALAVGNDNGPDFDVTEDTCTGQEVPGGGRCVVTVAFAPDAPGNRVGTVTVGDPGNALSVSLQLTGFGVRLGEPGEACLVTSDCAAGVCSDGVCCDQACDGTCETCATGVCSPQSRQEPCGNGSGVCFGVNQCRLPAGEPCTTDAECGGNLVCKACRFGGRQCTAPDACCGGCANPFECVAGACACPIQNDGLQQLDCGGGLCAINRENACCPGAAPPGCNCDPSDNLCKQCLGPGDCPAGAEGTVASCVGNQCQYGCNTALGFRSCNGRCIGPAQCCGNADCDSLCQQCNTSTNTCQTFAPGSPGRCGPGQVCQGLQCITLPGLGDACTGQCAEGACFNGTCCEAACPGGRDCDAQGRCPVCFLTETVHPLAANECGFAGGEEQYCVPADSADDLFTRARAACEACTAGPCAPASCTVFEEPQEAVGFASSAEPRHVWVYQEGLCNGLTIAPGQGYFDPIGDVTLTF